MSKTMSERVYERLPENYRLVEGTNKQMHDMIYSRLEEVEDMAKKVLDFRDVDKAEGHNLDLIGGNVLEFRNGKDDDEYRQFIKTKITSNLSKGDINTINAVARFLLKESFRNIVETWNREEYDLEPAAIALTVRNHTKYLPFDAMDRVLAAGVDLKWVLELKQRVPDIFIASATLSGEDITIYPYAIREISSQGKVYIATSETTGREETTIYPKEKEVI